MDCLAYTGASALPLLLAGAVLLILGAVLAVAAWRRGHRAGAALLLLPLALGAGLLGSANAPSATAAASTCVAATATSAPQATASATPPVTPSPSSSVICAPDGQSFAGLGAEVAPLPAPRPDRATVFTNTDAQTALQTFLDAHPGIAAPSIELVLDADNVNNTTITVTTFSIDESGYLVFEGDGIAAFVNANNRAQDYHVHAVLTYVLDGGCTATFGYEADSSNLA